MGNDWRNNCSWNPNVKDQTIGTFLVVQRLRVRASNAGGVGSIPGQGLDSTCHAVRPKVKIKTKIRPYYLKANLQQATH